MDDLFQMLFNSLPEAIGGLTVAAILAILGYFYKKLSNKKLKKFSKNNLKPSSNVANFFSIKQNTNTQVSEIPRILYLKPA